MADLVIEYKKIKNFVQNNSSNTALRYFAIILIASIYIITWVNLNSTLDWDTAARLGWFKKGVLVIGDVHFLINWVPSIFSHIGIDALSAYRIVTAISMLVLVLGVSKFTYNETQDNILAFLLAAFILFNKGFTTYLTVLEDNLPMYASLIFFVIYLLKGCWIRSAIFFSLSMLIFPTESLVYLPMMICFVLLKLYFEKIVKGTQRLSTQIKETISTQILLKFIIVTIILIIPSALIMFSWNLSLGSYIDAYILTTSYRTRPDWWYFSTNRTPLEQVHLVDQGIRATFGYMQSYPDTFWLLLGLILFVSIISFSPNRKTLCAIPTFLFLIVHTLFFDSNDYERWAFLPFFFIYFTAIGYAAKNESGKKCLKYLVLLIVLISALFMQGSYSSIGGHASAYYIYVTKLPELLDNKSIVLEAEPSGNDYLELYFNGNRTIFIKSDAEIEGIYRDNTINASDSEIIGIFRNNTIYASRSTYGSLRKKFPGIVFGYDTIYVNKFERKYNIVKLKNVEYSNNESRNINPFPRDYLISNSSSIKFARTGNFTGQKRDQLLILKSNPGSTKEDILQIADFANGSPARIEYDDRPGTAWLNANHSLLSGDFMGLGYDQAFHIDGDKIVIEDFSQGKAPAIVRYSEVLANNSTLKNLTDAKNAQFAGDFLGRGHSQVLFIDRNPNGVKLVISDFSKGKTPEMTEFSEIEGNSTLLSSLLDDKDKQFSGDFMSLGHSQLMMIDCNHTEAKVPMIIIADFSKEKKSASVRYQENWGESSVFSGWLDIDDTQLVGDFMGLGHSQVLFVNHDLKGGKIIIVDFSQGKPPANIKYWESWDQGTLFLGWLGINDTKIVGDFKDLGYSQVLFLNNSVNGSNATIVEFLSGKPEITYGTTDN